MNLSPEKIAGGKTLLELLDAANVDVGAALWVRFKDASEWKLGIYTSDNAGPRDFYKVVQRTLEAQKVTPKLDLAEVVFFKKTSPLLQLLKIVMKTPKKAIGGGYFAGNVINGQLIPDCYIYRLHV